jgi:glycopeptide antibiotics resistance protein
MRKLIVLLPVLAFTFYFILGHYHTDITRVTDKRLGFLCMELVLLYSWILSEVFVRRQDSVIQAGVQSSFFVYVFFVLTLTGYFFLFREITLHHWWQNMNIRIERKDRVNFTLLKIFKIYRWSDKQVIGNFIMLMPLGFYLPLLYSRISSFFSVAVVSFLVSTAIETLQLITSYRSADVDDILLNTLGACFGYLLFRQMTEGLKKRMTANENIPALH